MLPIDSVRLHASAVECSASSIEEFRRAYRREQRATSRSQFSPWDKLPYWKNVRLSPRRTYPVKIFERTSTSGAVSPQTDKYESPSCHFFSFLIVSHRSRVASNYAPMCRCCERAHTHTRARTHVREETQFFIRIAQCLKSSLDVTIFQRYRAGGARTQLVVT